MDASFNCFRRYTRYDVIAAFGLITIGTVIFALFASLINNPEVQNDSKRYPLAKFMLALSIVCTFASLM